MKTSTTSFNPTKKNIMVILLDYGIFDLEIKNEGKDIESRTIFVSTKVKNYVLRVSKLNTTEEKVKEEVYLLNELFAKGVKVPFVYPNMDGGFITKKIIDNEVWFCYLMDA